MIRSFLSWVAFFTMCVVGCFAFAGLVYGPYISDGTVRAKAIVPAHEVVREEGGHYWVGDRWKLSLVDAKGEHETWHFVKKSDYDRMEIGSHQAFEQDSDLPLLILLAVCILLAAYLAAAFTEATASLGKPTHSKKSTHASKVTLTK